MKTLRKIVRIDEEKCDGCGLCAPACAEGAIQVIDGKARLVSEVYCDGLGACLGECPQGAITIEEREAEEFDSLAVEGRLKSLSRADKQRVAGDEKEEFKGCPGALARMFEPSAQETASGAGEHTPASLSALGNWPVQINLVPVKAPCFKKKELLISADCVPFAFGDFHRRFLAGKTLLVGCPKLDDAEFYLNKLTRIFEQNEVVSVEVLFMEVPCCFGMANLVQLALERTGKSIPATFTKVSIKGEVLERREAI
ncbi:MAG TPA: 4Fe-4S binding protein [archaeon]|nr:4Fe-4S binding protein [archaeon]